MKGLSIIYRPGSKRPNASRDAKASAVLKDIAADVLALRMFSTLQAQLYAQLRQEERQTRKAELRDANGALEKERQATFAKLRALNGDPTPLESDDRADFFGSLSDETNTPSS